MFCVVTEMSRLSLRNSRLSFKTLGKLPVVLEESRRIYLDLIKGKLKDVNVWGMLFGTEGVSFHHALRNKFKKLGPRVPRFPTQWEGRCRN